MKSATTRSTILCPTDFSDNAKKAATVAAALAARSGATLNLVYAANLGPALLVRASERRVASRVGDAQLQEEKRRLKSSGAHIETVALEEGWTADALLKFARETQPELVVITSRRMSALDRWALGSVSDQLAQHVTCPTIVVRHAAPFLSWAAGKSSLKILAALDFGICTESVLRWIGLLGRIGPCELTACHVNWKLEDRDLTGAKPVALNARNPARIQASLERNLRKRVRDVLGDEGAEIVVKATWGAPEATLIETAEGTRAELIVTGTHQRHGLGWLWHGSVSRGLVHHAPMSVACVPTTAEINPRTAHVPQFRRVLVTTDLSAPANAAIPLACAAVPPGGTLAITHVVSQARAKRATKRTWVELRQALLGLVPVEAEAPGIRVEPHILIHEKPADAIALEAERFGADLICIASHGRSGWAKTLFGSVAHAVVERSRRPVLVARAAP